MRRLHAVAACVALLATTACARHATPDLTSIETDPAARWYSYALATGERHYEMRVKLKGTARLGEGFVQALAALAPAATTPPAPERDLPVDVELTASLAAVIRAEGDDRLVKMTYERLAGHVDIAGVRRDLTVADLALARGGATSFTYRMTPDGSTTPVPTSSDSPGVSSTTVPDAAGTEATTQNPTPVQRGLDLSCPHPPPGGAAPGQSWKIGQAVPFLGAAGDLLATNAYTLEGDNSAVMSSRLDAPLDTVVDLAALGATNPLLSAVAGAISPTTVRLGGNVAMSTACELTWPEQELLARTSTGHQRLVLAFAAPVGPPAALLAAGQFLVLDVDATSELRSV